MGGGNAARVQTLPRDKGHRRRCGGRAARKNFAPAVGALVTERPLQIVQIDHTKVDLSWSRRSRERCSAAPSPNSKMSLRDRGHLDLEVLVEFVQRWGCLLFHETILS
jgi:hypothetical protein